MAREYILECWNGQVWEFNDPACPISLRSEPKGIEGSSFTFDDQQNVNQAGVTFKARNDDPNFIELEVKVQSAAKGDEAEELLRTWRHSLGRGVQLGTFHTISDSGGDRFQVVRLAEKLAPPNYYKMRHSGVLTEEDGERVKLRSDESWWRKDPVVTTFTQGQLATATVHSESDEPVWPYYEITGPLQTPTFGIDGETVTLPTILSGQTWVIDTDPDFFQITDHTGADRSWDVGERWYKQAPAGDVDVPITFESIIGTNTNTRVKVTLPQLFWEGI
jgi:hypothetical protein